jgi:hypothetical protein
MAGADVAGMKRGHSQLVEATVDAARAARRAAVAIAGLIWREALRQVARERGFSPVRYLERLRSGPDFARGVAGVVVVHRERNGVPCIGLDGIGFDIGHRDYLTRTLSFTQPFATGLARRAANYVDGYKLTVTFDSTYCSTCNCSITRRRLCAQGYVWRQVIKCT